VAAGDIEFANQVVFYRARCAGLAPASAAAESARAAPAPAPAVRDVSPPPRPGAPPADSAAAAPRLARPFEIQVTAASTDRAAQQVADRLTRAGYQVRIVAGTDGLRRVRVGPYETVEAAEAAAGAVRRLVGGAPFVVRSP